MKTQVVIDRENASGSTLSPTRGSRPGHPSESTHSLEPVTVSQKNQKKINSIILGYSEILQ